VAAGEGTSGAAPGGNIPHVDNTPFAANALQVGPASSVASNIAGSPSGTASGCSRSTNRRPNITTQMTTQSMSIAFDIENPDYMMKTKDSGHNQPFKKWLSERDYAISCNHSTLKTALAPKSVSLHSNKQN
jgi:hypothetical protein